MSTTCLLPNIVYFYVRKIGRSKAIRITTTTWALITTLLSSHSKLLEWKRKK